MNADGILVYGVQLDDDWANQDHEETIAKAYGWTGEESCGVFLRKEQVPVDVTYHCSHNNVMCTLAIVGTEHRVSQGYARHISAESLEIKPGWRGALKDACKRLNVRWEEPAWWLQAFYG